MDEYELRLACQWIGKSLTVAMRRYSLLKKKSFSDVGSNKLKATTKATSGRNRGMREPKTMPPPSSPANCVTNMTQIILANVRKYPEWIS